MAEEWRRWRPGEKDDLATRYGRGELVSDLAIRFQRKESNIRTVLQSMGVCNRQRRVNEKDKKKIFGLIAKGKTDPQIAEATGFCRSTVQKFRLASGRRKYRYGDMGDDGWPVDASQRFAPSKCRRNDDAIIILTRLERDGPQPVESLASWVINKRRAVGILARLLSKRFVAKHKRKSGTIYSLSPRVANMRRDFKSGKAK